MCNFLPAENPIAIEISENAGEIFKRKRVFYWQSDVNTFVSKQ
jgi:hypothetical protein